MARYIDQAQSPFRPLSQPGYKPGLFQERPGDSPGAQRPPSPYPQEAREHPFQPNQGGGGSNGGGGGGYGGATSFDYTSDPILARVRALGQQRVSEAEAYGLARKNQLAIGYGDPAFARKLGLDENTAKTAEGNPFSTTKELSRGKKRRDVFDINRPLSDYRNLFYSSERARQLALSGEQYLRDDSQAQGAIQQQLGEIAQAVLQAKLQAQAEQVQAEESAYNRALQRALGG